MCTVIASGLVDIDKSMITTKDDVTVMSARVQ